MVVDSIVIARFAEANADGTVSMLGAGMHTFFSMPMPPETAAEVVVPPSSRRPVGSAVNFAIIARWLASRTEMQRPHQVELRIADTDGISALPNRIAFPVVVQDNKLIAAGGLLPGHLVVGLNPFFPPVFGAYSVEVVIDDDVKKQTTFQIITPPAIVPPSPGAR